MREYGLSVAKGKYILDLPLANRRGIEESKFSILFENCGMSLCLVV